MDNELELNKANRLKLARAFKNNPRVDCSIDCVIERQMGRAFVDSLSEPTAYRITVGPFWYFAGDAYSPGGNQMLEGFPAYNLLMPSPSDWLVAAQKIYGDRLKPFARYSFSTSELSLERVSGIYENSKHREHIIPIDADLATCLAEKPDSYLEISDFDSAQDFIQRGLGFAAMDGDTVMGVAYSSLVCSSGIEVSLYVEEPYRQQGIATALGSRLVLECIQQNRRPNWDAANPESCKLAKKLGYIFTGSYDAYYYLPAKLPGGSS
jgi:GNAT superfamily N-acetyltransferase